MVCFGTVALTDFSLLLAMFAFCEADVIVFCANDSGAVFRGGDRAAESSGIGLPRIKSFICDFVTLRLEQFAHEFDGK